MTAAHPPIRLPAGVRDFLPRPAARRRAIAERLLAEFEAWGFERLITPLFERADVLERGLGDGARAAAIRFIEPSTGDVVALRPDITPQVARIAATRLGEVTGPLRLCYEGAVTRLGNGVRGQREILQTGVELIGAGSPEGDAELLAVAAATLGATRLAERRLDLGHVALARYALAAIDDPARRAQVAARLAKKDRAGVAELAAGVARGPRLVLEALPSLYGAPGAVLADARALSLPAPARRAIDAIEEVLDLASAVVDRDLHRSITVDFGELRGFEYYTGMRLAGYLGGAGVAVLRGGRYDDLVGRYGKPQLATGFAVDVEAIAEAEVAAGLSAPNGRDGVLVVAGSKGRAQAARVAAGLRKAGLRAAVDLGGRKSRAALVRYAGEVGLSWVLVLGAGEGAMVHVASGESAPLSATALRRATTGDAAALAGVMQEKGEQWQSS